VSTWCFDSRQGSNSCLAYEFHKLQILYLWTVAHMFVIAPIHEIHVYEFGAWSFTSFKNIDNAIFLEWSPTLWPTFRWQRHYPKLPFLMPDGSWTWVVTRMEVQLHILNQSAPPHIIF
jgi:hypothetical protein